MVPAPMPGSRSRDRQVMKQPAEKFPKPRSREGERVERRRGWDRTDGVTRPLVSGWLHTDVLQSLPPPWRSSVSPTQEEVTPEHRLW